MCGEHCLQTAGNGNKRALACLAIVAMVAFSGCGTSGSAPGAGPSAGSAGAAVTSQPVLGYTWDAAHAGFRTMFGVPGAASVSDNLVNEGGFSSAVLCMRKSYALLTNTAGNIYVVSLPDGDPLQITSQVMNNQRIVVSPSCTTALAYAQGASRGVLIAGLPSTPQIQSLNFGAAGSLVGAAVGDLGDVLLASSQPDGTASVQLLPASGSMSPLGSLQAYGAMAFVPGSATALLADAGANKVLMVSPSATAVSLASSSDGISLPLAIASSADGRLAVIANRSGTPLVRVALAAKSAPAKVACLCKPSELVPLAGNAVFQVSDLSSGTIFAVDATPAIPRTIFIPASRNVINAGLSR
jgi:hypothetical protein